MTNTELSERVKEALESADPDAYADLLAPDVHWGAPDSPQWGCHNRNEVLSWYKAARRNGVRAKVTEIVVGRDCLLVGIAVSGRDDPEAGTDGESARWQVMRIENGLVADIAGFEDRAEAVARAGVGA